MYCASHAARAGWTRPFSSVARLCSKARSPFHCQGSRKRVTLFEKTGSCSAASRQLAPPSAETSTLAIFPAPDQARPEISYQPGPCMLMPTLGWVITDFTPIRNVNWRALPSGVGSVYFEVSSLACIGASRSLIRRSHFTLELPSHPGSSRRSGTPLHSLQLTRPWMALAGSCGGFALNEFGLLLPAHSMKQTRLVRG